MLKQGCAGQDLTTKTVKRDLKTVRIKITLCVYLKFPLAIFLMDISHNNSLSLNL